jgi:hypothetical protein
VLLQKHKKRTTAPTTTQTVAPTIALTTSTQTIAPTTTAQTVALTTTDTTIAQHAETFNTTSAQNAETIVVATTTIQKPNVKPKGLKPNPPENT